MKRLWLCLLLFAAMAHATAYTASVTGNWNNSATWGGAGVPGTGDTVTINDGITVTVNVSTTVGSSPTDDTGTPAIQCASTTGTGILSVSAGVVLTFRGPVRQCIKGGDWTVGAGASLIHDSHLSAATNCNTTPASCPNYSWVIGLVNCTSGTCGSLILNGASGNRVTLDIAASSGNAGGLVCNTTGTTTCLQSAGKIHAAWVNINKWGLAGTAYNTYSLHSYPYNSGDASYCNHCYMTSVGHMALSNPRNSTTWQFNNSIVKGNLNANGTAFLTLFEAGQPTTGMTGQVYEIKDSYIGGSVRIVTSGGYKGGDVHVVFTNDLLLGNDTGTTGADSPFTGSGSPGFGDGTSGKWDLVMLYTRGNSSVTSNAPSGTLKRTMVMMAGNFSNLHPMAGQVADVTWDGVVVERQYDSSINGDSDTFQSGGAATVVVNLALKNALFIPTPGGQAPGSAWNQSGTQCDGTAIVCPHISITHNTYIGSDSGANLVVGAGGEGNTAWDGLYQTISNNIVWAPASGLGWIMHWYTSTTAVANSFRNVGNNAYWNLTGTPYTGIYGGNAGQYNPTAGTYGNGDLPSTNPGFPDSTRNFLNWCKSIDGTLTTWDLCIAKFPFDTDQAGYNSAYSLAAYYNWVRAGFAPTNAALKGTASDGGDIGAMPVQVASTAMVPRHRGMVQ